MKPNFPLLIGLCTIAMSANTLRAELHEFRNAEGKTIHAEIQAASSDEILIKLENGRTMRVKSALFVPEDQQYIRAWIDAHPTPLKLQVKFTEKPEDEEEEESGALKTTTQLTRYDIQIANGGTEPVEGCELHYQIYKSKGGFYSSNANQGGFDEFADYFMQYGTSQIKPIPPRETTVVTTDLIIVNEFESKGGGQDEDEELIGVWIRVIDSKKRIVFEAKSSDSKLKDAKWYDPNEEEEEEKSEDSQ